MALLLPFPDFEKTLNLLVVDDQEFDRKMIRARLTEVMPASTQITEVASAQEVVKLLNDPAIGFDCVLLDMNLPDMHGMDLTNLLQSLRPELAIVVITVEADMDKALKCIKAGAEDFIIKGEYSNEGLYRTIRYAMERRQSSIENFKLQQELIQARELSAAQKDFIHLISHEFRTPIAIISGAVQLLSAKAPELKQGTGASQFQKINQALQRLVNLLDNVLRLSMVEDGKEAFQPETLDMREAIFKTLEHFEDSRIHYDAPAKPMQFFGDPRLVEYTLYNILSNALKYSAADKPVTVESRIDTQGITLRIIDHGSGMSPEMLKRMGERFHRDVTTSHIEGTGLGVHLAKRFMDMHGGRLEYQSEIGIGTVTTLFFPCYSGLVAE